MILYEKNGIKIEEKEDGIKITTVKGTILKLDKEGELVEQIIPTFDYFFRMDMMARQIIVPWLVYVKPKTKAQEEFVEVIRDMLSDSTKCYDYKIAIIEPSPSGSDGITYDCNSDVYTLLCQVIGRKKREMLFLDIQG